MVSVSDLAVLGEWIEDHRPVLLAMLQWRMPPSLAARCSAEDILQEVFFEARQKYAAFKTKGTMTTRAWLYQLTRDCLAATWRRENRNCRNPQREMPWPDHSAAMLGLSLIHQGTSPSEAVLRDELRQRVQAAVERLKPHQQELLWMRHRDQLSFAEIASILSISEQAARVSHLRALRQFQVIWEATDGSRMSRT